MKEQEFVELFVEELDVVANDVKIDTDLGSLEEWNSMGIMLITSWLTDNFSIDIQIEDVKQMKVIRDLYDKVITQ